MNIIIEHFREELKTAIEHDLYVTLTTESCEELLEALIREQFIKPCISGKQCEHNKNIVLDKMIAEIYNLKQKSGYTFVNIDNILSIIYKYR